MHGKEYQQLAMRTKDCKGMDKIHNFSKNFGNETTSELLNGALGLAGEAGEVVDIIKKIKYSKI